MTISSLVVPKIRKENTQKQESMGNIFSFKDEPQKQSFWQKALHYFVPYEQTVEYSRTSSPSSSRSSSRVSSSSQENNMVGPTFKQKRKQVSDEVINLETPNKIRKLNFNDSSEDLRIKMSANNLQSREALKKNNSFDFSKITIKNPDRKKMTYNTGSKLAQYKRNYSINDKNSSGSDAVWRSLSLMYKCQDDKVPELSKDLSYLNKDPNNKTRFGRIGNAYETRLRKSRNEIAESDDDIIFISERKIPVYEKLNKKYNDSLVFNKKYFELVYEKYLAACKEQKKVRDELLMSKLVSKETILPKLTDEEINKVKKEFNQSTRRAVRLSNRFKLDIYNTDFATLKPGQWLNSTVIEYFLKSLEAEDSRLVAFSPFFITKLSSDGFNSVRRWLKMKKKDIMKIDKMLIPINVNENHWVCAMVDFKNKKILYLDSLCNTSNRSSFMYLERIKDYVIKQSERKIGQDFELVHLPSQQQNNGFDCGIFILMNMLQLAKDIPFVLNQNDASDFRYHIANEILKHGL